MLKLSRISSWQDKWSYKAKEMHFAIYYMRCTEMHYTTKISSIPSSCITILSNNNNIKTQTRTKELMQINIKSIFLVLLLKIQFKFQEVFKIQIYWREIVKTLFECLSYCLHLDSRLEANAVLSLPLVYISKARKCYVFCAEL